MDTAIFQVCYCYQRLKHTQALSQIHVQPTHTAISSLLLGRYGGFGRRVALAR